MRCSRSPTKSPSCATSSTSGRLLQADARGEDPRQERGRDCAGRTPATVGPFRPRRRWIGCRCSSRSTTSPVDQAYGRELPGPLWRSPVQLHGLIGSVTRGVLLGCSAGIGAGSHSTQNCFAESARGQEGRALRFDDRSKNLGLHANDTSQRGPFPSRSSISGSVLRFISPASGNQRNTASQ